MATPFDPETAENSEEIEKQFAVKAVRQLEIYWNLLESMPGSTIRLTKYDDEIDHDFINSFPEYASSEWDGVIIEDEMKSPEGKRRWREFMMRYEKKVDSYNFGSILRISPKVEYEEKTTIFVPRMQLLAIEIHRNRLKLNDWIYEEKQRKKGNKE